MNLRSFSLPAALLLFAGTVALAQQQPARSASSGHDNSQAKTNRNNRPFNSVDDYHIMPEGMTGPWWHNTGLAQKVGLTADQTRRMDEIFHQNAQQIHQQHQDLHKQRDVLQAMLDANPPDTAKILPQLDRIAQARAAEEVSWDKVLLSIRTVLTPDQWNKLQAENRAWQAQHPQNSQPDDHQNDHRGRGFQGRSGGGTAPSPAQP